MKWLLCLGFGWLFLVCGIAVAQTKDDVPKLVKQLKDKDEITRFRAAKSLGQLGAEAKEAIQDLTEATKDDDEDVRRAAKAALDKIKSALSSSRRKDSLDAVERHMQTLKGDKPDLWGSAAEALAKMLKETDEIVRLRVIQALGEGGVASKDAVLALKEIAKDDDEVVRLYVKKALNKITAAINADRRKKALEVMAPLLKDLKNRTPGTRIHALEEIAKLGPDAKEATQDVVQAILDLSPTVRETAAATLEKLDPALHKLVITALLDISSSNRSNAIREIGKMGADGRVALPLLWYFASNPYVQSTPTVSPRGTRRGAVRGGIEHSEHWFVAVKAMCQIAPDDVNTIKMVVDLVTATGHLSKYRLEAIDLLRTIEVEPKVAVRALMTVLVGDTRYRVRIIEELARFGSEAKDAVPILTRLKLDSSAAVREAANRALEKIGPE